MNMQKHSFSRRAALARAFQIPVAAGAAGLSSLPRMSSAEPTDSGHSSSEVLKERVAGLLLGSMIGDAAGGPVEFKEPDAVKHVLPGVREWPDDELLDEAIIRKLADSFRLLSYAELRAKTEPYAHWTESAAPGTVTDDTRHKIFLINALRNALQDKKLPIAAPELAKQYIAFCRSSVVQKAGRSPKRLFQIIEQDLPNKTWLEAHVPFVSAFSLLRLCDFDPLAAMHLTLDLGHDTDSTAQLLGAFVGAIHGPNIFSNSLQRQVSKRFKVDFEQTVSQWVDLLVELSDRDRHPAVIQFL